MIVRLLAQIFILLTAIYCKLLYIIHYLLHINLKFFIVIIITFLISLTEHIMSFNLY